MEDEIIVEVEKWKKEEKIKESFPGWKKLLGELTIQKPFCYSSPFVLFNTKKI